MGGFINKTINRAFGTGAINFIIAHLIKCSEQMKENCAATDNLLKNDEDAITNRLVAVHLNEKTSIFRYEPQSSEHYDIKTDHYIGRTDIKVISRDYFRDKNAYHIIECKRIDGTVALNKDYITEGVERFLSPASQPKYSSCYLENIMFGYVVKSINIPANADKIDGLQNTLLKTTKASPFILQQNGDSQYYVYICKYTSDVIRIIKLSHLFFDFSGIVDVPRHDKIEANDT